MTEEKHGLFKVGQNIVLLNHKHEVLIIKEKLNNPDNKWNWPGGRLNEGEEWEDGLRRELKEELDIDKFEIIGIYAIRTWAGNPHNYSVQFVGRVPKGTKIVLNEKELQDYAWVSAENVDGHECGYKVSRDAKDILKKYG